MVETSGLEVYISFALTTGYMTPVYDRSLKKKTRLCRSAFVMRDESIRADLVRTDLSSQLRIFVQFAKWMGTFVDIGPLVCQRGGLKKLGFHNPTFYLLRKVQLVNHDKVAANLWKFFHVGRKSTLNMKASWKP